MFLNSRVHLFLGYIGQCIAQYDYDAVQNDELTIKAGDVINLSEKQDSDWWFGELNGKNWNIPCNVCAGNELDDWLERK